MYALDATPAVVLLVRRCRLGVTEIPEREADPDVDDTLGNDDEADVEIDVAVPPICGGLAAMGTTPVALAASIGIDDPPRLIGVLPAEVPPAEAGEAESCSEGARARAGGVVTGVLAETREFFRVPFLAARVVAVEVMTLVRMAVLAVVEAGMVVPEPRLRFLITSVLSDSGRTTPWSLRKRPHALHRGWPSGLRRQSGVVWVKQLVQVVGKPVAGVVSPLLDPLADAGRDGRTLPPRDPGGELGDDCGRACVDVGAPS